jgi:hypothetical protein
MTLRFVPVAMNRRPVYVDELRPGRSLAHFGVQSAGPSLANN